MPRLLSLFDGTGAITRPFREGGWEVRSLDIDGKHGADIVQNILDKQIVKQGIIYIFIK